MVWSRLLRFAASYVWAWGYLEHCSASFVSVPRNLALTWVQMPLPSAILWSLTCCFPLGQMGYPASQRGGRFHLYAFWMALLELWPWFSETWSHRLSYIQEFFPFLVSQQCFAIQKISVTVWVIFSSMRVSLLVMFSGSFKKYFMEESK